MAARPTAWRGAAASVSTADQKHSDLAREAVGWMGVLGC
jgi:hypothetical protein